MIFSSTKKSMQLKQITYALIGVMSVEVLLLGIAICYFMDGQALFMIITTIILIYIYAFYSIYALLKANHRIVANDLIVCFGKRFKGVFPLTEIISAEAECLTTFPKSDIIGLTVFREGDCLYCLSRKTDIVHLCLSKPIMVKAPTSEKSNSKHGLVREVLLNVDEPEKFLEKIRAVIYLKKQSCGHLQDTIDILESRDKSKGNSEDRVEDNIEDNVEGIIKDNHKTKRIIFESEGVNKTPNLELEHLIRYYKDYPAVKDISLKVYPGEIFGFLGVNGAGKSTTIKMITGLLRPTAGKILVKGENLWKPGTTIRRKIGYIPDTPLLYERLTLREHLMMLGNLNHLPDDLLREKIQEIICSFNLQSWADEMIATYSMGMQRKVSVALALLTEPDIVIVDELTNAFDAQTLAEIKELLLKLRNNGKTVFVSTHVMDVAEKLCDRVAIINQGQLVAVGTVKELCKTFSVDEGLEALFLKLTSFRMDARRSIS